MRRWAGFAGWTAALLAVYALSRETGDLGVAWRDHALASWIRVLAVDFLLLAVAALGALCVLALAFRFAPRGGGWRVAALAAAVPLAAVAALVAHEGIGWLAGAVPAGELRAWREWLVGALCEYVAIVAATTIGVECLRRADRDAARVHAAELERIALARQAEDARVRLLRAQIEPHFLFNTLANVRWLARTDAAAARAMLDDLRVYFDAALPRLATDAVDLGSELALIDAYLGLHKVRMGERLTFDVAADPGLEHLRLPPVMLLTLVENAIKHGIAPAERGGHITVRARAEDDWLVVDVRDTGRGFASAGAGDGLANLRARLATEFGAAGRLELAHNTPSGVVASLILPRAALEAVA